MTNEEMIEILKKETEEFKEEIRNYKFDLNKPPSEYDKRAAERINNLSNEERNFLCDCVDAAAEGIVYKHPKFIYDENFDLAPEDVALFIKDCAWVIITNPVKIARLAFMVYSIL